MCRIYVIFTGKTISLDIQPDTTVMGLKMKIQDKEGISPIQQRLFFAGKPIDHDDSAIETYGIRQECTLHLTLRSRSCICWVVSPVIKTEEFEKGEERYNEAMRNFIGEEFEKFYVSSSTSLRRIGRRISREIMDCYRKVDPSRMISLLPVHKNSIYHWEVVIKGKRGTCYESGTFRIRIEYCSEKYPFIPLKIKFLTKIFHPMYRPFVPTEDNHICPLIVESEWSPAFRLRYFVNGILYNMNENIEVLYKDKVEEFPDGISSVSRYDIDLLRKGKYKDFERIAKLWTRFFAGGKSQSNEDIDHEERFLYCCSDRFPQIELKFFPSETSFSISKVLFMCL